jgi:hypothetical protein
MYIQTYIYIFTYIYIYLYTEKERESEGKAGYLFGEKERMFPGCIMAKEDI